MEVRKDTPQVIVDGVEAGVGSILQDTEVLIMMVDSQENVVGLVEVHHLVPVELVQRVGGAIIKIKVGSGVVEVAAVHMAVEEAVVIQEVPDHNIQDQEAKERMVFQELVVDLITQDQVKRIQRGEIMMTDG